MSEPSTMHGAPDVLVIIPARDEADSIENCLASVLGALEHARTQGHVSAAFVSVGAHRCLDDTAATARAVMSRSSQTQYLVDETAAQVSVGVIRSHLVSCALARWPELVAQRTWLFSTDADSVVAPTWVSDTLDTACAESADAVAGLVDLVAWEADHAARLRYAELIASGLTPTGHRHAYAANLAVRLDLFLRIGGFADVAHGEEHRLLREIREGGGTVATPRIPLVRTSGRVPGRTALGLGHLLSTLVESAGEEAG